MIFILFPSITNCLIEQNEFDQCRIRNKRLDLISIIQAVDHNIRLHYTYIVLYCIDTYIGRMQQAWRGRARSTSTSSSTIDRSSTPPISLIAPHFVPATVGKTNNKGDARETDWKPAEWKTTFDVLDRSRRDERKCGAS